MGTAQTRIQGQGNRENERALRKNHARMEIELLPVWQIFFPRSCHPEFPRPVESKKPDPLSIRTLSRIGEGAGEGRCKLASTILPDEDAQNKKIAILAADGFE